MTKKKLAAGGDGRKAVNDDLNAFSLTQISQWSVLSVPNCKGNNQGLCQDNFFLPNAKKKFFASVKRSSLRKKISNC